MKREKDVTYIATISGGKDSVTMCDLLLSNGYPVDYIIFNDTTAEFNDMYNYIEKIKKYFKERYSKEIVVTVPIRNFKDSILRKVTRSKTESRNGQYVGIPVASKGDVMCHLRKTLKIDPTTKWIRKNIKGDYKTYIGYTVDEKNRATENNINIYPLIEYFNMKEIDCKKYLIENEMENILYRHFSRTGCKLCPFKSEQDWWKIYNYYNDDYEEAKNIEDTLINHQKEYIYFLGKKPLRQWEDLFKQGSLFDFSDEPLKDCFCKI